MDIAADDSEWNDKDDQPLYGGSSSPPPPPAGVDNTDTTLKTITPSDRAYRGARRKTGFPSGTTRLTAVISGHPTVSEDGEFKDYFNPRIYPDTHCTPQVQVLWQQSI